MEINYVEPIRDLRKLDDILGYLKRTNTRNYLMFCVGIYTGLRISDILKLKVRDLQGKEVNMRETKTRKQKIIPISKELKKVLKELKDYLDLRNPDDYLIQSREGLNKPISRDMALKIVKRACEEFEVYNTGTHTLRKTFGYHYYQQTKDIVVLQRLFNHSSPSVTLRYIGIVQDTLNNAIINFSYAI